MKLNKPKFIKDDSAQVGSIILVVLGLFFLGFMYILLSGYMAHLLTFYNTFSQLPQFPTTQAHRDGMATIFYSWWILPVLFLLLALVYIIKSGIKSRTSEAY